MKEYSNNPQTIFQEAISENIGLVGNGRVIPCTNWFRTDAITGTTEQTYQIFGAARSGALGNVNTVNQFNSSGLIVGSAVRVQLLLGTSSAGASGADMTTALDALVAMIESAYMKLTINQANYIDVSLADMLQKSIVTSYELTTSGAAQTVDDLSIQGWLPLDPLVRFVKNVGFDWTLRATPSAAFVNAFPLARWHVMLMGQEFLDASGDN